MFGFLKSELTKKIETVKFNGIESVVTQWDNIGTILRHCKRKEKDNVNKILNMCWGEYNNAISEYLQRMKEINTSSRSCGKDLFEYYDIIYKLLDEYEHMISDLSDVGFNEILIELQVMSHYTFIMGEGIRIRSEASRIIDNVAKSHFGQTISDMTDEINSLGNQISNLQNRLTEEYSKNNSAMLNFDGKRGLDLSAESTLQTQVFVNSYSYAINHPESVALYNKIDELKKQRRKMMEEY